MILSIGEILTDMIGESNVYKMYIGGAPFNVAVNARRFGADVGFVGKVGKDVAGKFILKEIKKYDLADSILIDEKRNTTMAFVSRVDGERYFSFVRHDTADYHLSIDELPSIDSAKIIHLGTLMLSEKEGVDFAEKVIQLVKSKNKLLSLDANFRDDLFETKEKRNAVMMPILLRADILKFSTDELFDVTGKADIKEAVKELGYNGLLFVTDGAKGSYAFCSGKTYFAPSEKVKPVDTTGAGDAYYGTILAQIDKCINDRLPITDYLQTMIEQANIQGAKAVLHEGAV